MNFFYSNKYRKKNTITTTITSFQKTQIQKILRDQIVHILLYNKPILALIVDRILMNDPCLNLLNN
jgi:hypothetical protein